VASGGFEAQTLILACCGLIAAVALLWSLVPPRDKTVAPGLRLEAHDHPRLFAEIQGVAKALDESMPEEVYLTASVDAFVTQWGGTFGYKSCRVMALGLPLMQVLTLSQFRPVLAHEFGHHYSDDARLVPWVHRSRAAIVRNLRSLAKRSPVIPSVMRAPMGKLLLSLIIRLLLGYWRVFLKATQLVSRRQQYRADEIACHIAGSQAFIDGLRATDAAELAFPAFWDQELVSALQHGCLPPVCEGFSRFLATPKVAKAIEANLERELRQPRPSPFDEHPPMRDRIAATQRLPCGSPSEKDCPATTLIGDLAITEMRLLEFVIRPKLDLSGFKRTAWDKIGSTAVLPAWKASIRDFSKLLSGIAAEAFPDAVGDPRSLGSRIPDPKGMLLTREQRDQRAARLLAMATSISLTFRE
jgi:Zn-dependent protease with chaperone function